VQKKTITSQRAARTFLLGAAISGLLLTAGCAELPKTMAGAVQQTPEKAVAARSEARADAFIKGGTAKAYPFLTPAYRSGTSLTQYQMRYPQVYKLFKAKVLKVTCPADDSCDAQTEWTYQLNGPVGKMVGPVPTVLNERWIKVDGQWWYYLKN
jgi:outer membrane murein-binding lipoprotein Lpp